MEEESDVEQNKNLVSYFSRSSVSGPKFPTSVVDPFFHGFAAFVCIRSTQFPFLILEFLRHTGDRKKPIKDKQKLESSNTSRTKKKMELMVPQSQVFLLSSSELSFLFFFLTFTRATLRKTIYDVRITDEIRSCFLFFLSVFYGCTHVLSFWHRRANGRCQSCFPFCSAESDTHFSLGYNKKHENKRKTQT